MYRNHGSRSSYYWGFVLVMNWLVAVTSASNLEEQQDPLPWKRSTQRETGSNLLISHDPITANFKKALKTSEAVIKKGSRCGGNQPKATKAAQAGQDGVCITDICIAQQYVDSYFDPTGCTLNFKKGTVCTWYSHRYTYLHTKFFAL